MGAYGHRPYNIVEHGEGSRNFADFQAATGLGHDAYLRAVGQHPEQLRQRFVSRNVSSAQFETRVHAPAEDKLPYDDDPNNWTARIRDTPLTSMSLKPSRK